MQSNRPRIRGRHPFGKRAIQIDHRVEHARGGVRAARCECANRRRVAAVVPVQMRGPLLIRAVRPRARLAFTLLGAPQIADRANVEAVQRAVIAIGEVAQHAGAIDASPAHRAAALRRIAADVAKVTAAVQRHEPWRACLEIEALVIYRGKVLGRGRAFSHIGAARRTGHCFEGVAGRNADGFEIALGVGFWLPMSRAWSGGIGAKMRQACVGMQQRPERRGNRRPDSRRERRRRHARAFDFHFFDVLRLHLRDQPVQLLARVELRDVGRTQIERLGGRGRCVCRSLVVGEGVGCSRERDRPRSGGQCLFRCSRSDVHDAPRSVQMRASRVYIRSPHFSLWAALGRGSRHS